MSIIRKRKKGRMVKKMRSGVILGLSTLLAVTGASATAPGVREVKGPLEVLGTTITVAGQSCAANGRTKYERNDQHVTPAEFAVGMLVKLEIDSADQCLELENETHQSDGHGSSGSSDGNQSRERFQATLAPAAGADSASKGKVKAEKKGPRSSFEAELKLVLPDGAAAPAAITIQVGDVVCEMKKGKVRTKRGRDGAPGTKRVEAKFKQSVRLTNGVPEIKGKAKGSCPGPITIANGLAISVSVDGNQVLEGELAPKATSTPAP